MRRIGALAAALGIAGVAGAIFDANGQARAFDRTAQVAANIGGQSLERREIKRVQTLGLRRYFGKRGQKPRQSFAAPRRRNQQGRAVICARKHVDLMQVQRPALGGEPV